MMFFKISQNSLENTCARVTFLIKLQASGGCFWSLRAILIGFFALVHLLSWFQKYFQIFRSRVLFYCYCYCESSSLSLQTLCSPKRNFPIYHTLSFKNSFIRMPLMIVLTLSRLASNNRSSILDKATAFSCMFV